MKTFGTENISGKQDDPLLGRHIGESILELLNKGYTTQVEPVPVDMTVENAPNRVAFMTVPADEQLGPIQPVGHGICRIDELGSRLDVVRDLIRTKRGEPTLSDEVAALLMADAKHTAAEPVVIGPDACCSNCGSKKPLWLKRTVVGIVPWDSGKWMNDEYTGDETGAAPRPGEILTCPDCQKHFSVGQ